MGEFYDKYGLPGDEFEADAVYDDYGTPTSAEGQTAQGPPLETTATPQLCQGGRPEEDLFPEADNIRDLDGSLYNPY